MCTDRLESIDSMRALTLMLVIADALEVGPTGLGWRAAQSAPMCGRDHRQLLAAFHREHEIQTGSIPGYPPTCGTAPWQST